MIPIDTSDGINLQGGATSGVAKTSLATSHWAKVYAYCQASATCTWAAGVVGDQVPAAVRTGSMVILGPITVPVGQKAEVIVAGAPANSDIAIVYRGYQSEVSDGSDLAGVLDTPQTDGSLQSATVSLASGTIVGTTDAGLAGSIAQALTRFTLLTSSALTVGGTTTLNTGAGTANPYPNNSASYQLVIAGLQGTSFGCRLVSTKQDGSGNSFGYVQRDTAIVTLDKLIASGILDAPTTIFAITLPAGAPSGCIVYLYTTALTIQDNFYDTGIYENTSSQSGVFQPGYDGTLVRVTNTIAASGNQTYQLPTYRGPVQIGMTMSQAGHIAIAESSYTGTLLDNYTATPISASGQAEQLYIELLGATSNAIDVFNDSASNPNSFFLKVRAVKDLLD